MNGKLLNTKIESDACIVHVNIVTAFLKKIFNPIRLWRSGRAVLFTAAYS